jgi:pyrroloquinoline quinone (PQQ) biosynthesis protein C
LAVTNAVDRYGAPIPQFIRDIKGAVNARVAATNIVDAMRALHPDALREFFTIYWPFVDQFPRIIRQGVVRTIRRAQEDLDLVKAVSHVGRNVVRDESNHRSLWLISCWRIGLTETDLKYDSPAPPVARLIRLFGELEGSHLFFGFAAVEMVAETVSLELMKSEPFRRRLGGEGLRWFDVHLEHPGDLSHEELVLKLAAAFSTGPLTAARARRTIMQVTDLFVEAADLASHRAVTPDRADSPK